MNTAVNTAHVLPLFRASFTMVLRARGVLYVFVYSPALMLALALMQDLDWGVDGRRIDFRDFVIPGWAPSSPPTCSRTSSPPSPRATAPAAY